jgi:L-cysteine desulfidase
MTASPAVGSLKVIVTTLALVFETDKGIILEIVPLSIIKTSTIGNPVLPLLPKLCGITHVSNGDTWVCLKIEGTHNPILSLLLDKFSLAYLRRAESNCYLI